MDALSLRYSVGEKGDSNRLQEQGAPGKNHIRNEVDIGGIVFAASPTADENICWPALANSGKRCFIFLEQAG